MASRVFYASGAGPGGADAAAGAAGRPRQQQYTPRRSVEPEGGRERRPPQQLYVPPRHRQGGASSGFNRASSPGLSTRSEIVTSWRVHATPPPRCASPGPLSPGSARPPAGPRRRLSHQASWDSSGGGGGGAWRQSGESLSQSRPSSRQSSVEPGGGSPRKRSGRRRRRSGRRSRSKSEDRPASAAEPMSPEQAAPWRHGHRDSWDGGQPAPTARPPSPRGPARPRFQQVYVPPPRRGQESPAPAAAAPLPRAPPDWPSPARQPPATGRGRGAHTPQRVASPAPVYGDPRPGPAPTPPPGDGPGSTASLGRRGSRRRRRTRDGPSGGGGGSGAQSPAPDRRRSVSPTDLIASLQLESGGVPAPGEPQSPTDVMLHLGVRPSAPLPRTDSLGQLVNTTDDEKVTLGGGRGRGRGRTPRQPGPPGGPAVYLPQSDEVKAAALRRPHSAQAKDRWADVELNAGPLSPSIIMSGTRVADTPTKPAFETSPRHQDAVIRQSPGRGEQRHVNARPHEPQQQQPPRPAVSHQIVSQSPLSGPAVSQSPAVTSPPSTSPGAVVVPERAPVAPAPAPAPVAAPAVASAEERTPPAHQSPSAVSPPPPSEPAPAPASPTRDPAPSSSVPVATDPPTSTADHSSEEAAATTTQPPSSDSPTPEIESATAASPETTTDTASPEREASDSVPIPERTRRRSASFSGLFNQSLDEPFNWADEVEEWEKRFNDEGDEAAADAADKTRRSSAEKRPSGSGSGSGGGGRSRQHDRPDMDDDRSSDPSLPAHVIELYGFPPGFSKQDFNVVFADFAASGFDVRPVDDRTALGVFSSAACASQALRLRHPMLLSRPLAQASSRSRQKAAQPANVQLPHRARPETSALHAGRMVASALGVRAPSDGRARQRRDNERRKLKDAKDKKRLTNKQRDDAWEGRF